MDKEIWPGDRVLVYDNWAFGRKGWMENKGEYRPATVLKRYGWVSEWMTKEYGYENAKYPDCVDVRFDCGRESRGHFTSGVKKIV